jgi:hypothetical protein
VLIAADGASSRIARELAGALPASEMEVAFGYRAPLSENEEAPTVIAFLPGWAGYAWAFRASITFIWHRHIAGRFRPPRARSIAVEIYDRLPSRVQR